jgi:hypothetical protein
MSAHACPACQPIAAALSELLALLPRVPTCDDAQLERQLTAAIERCHIELASAQHLEPIA